MLSRRELMKSAAVLTAAGPTVLATPQTSPPPEPRPTVEGGEKHGVDGVAALMVDFGGRPQDLLIPTAVGRACCLTTNIAGAAQVTVGDPRQIAPKGAVPDASDWVNKDATVLRLLCGEGYSRVFRLRNVWEANLSGTWDGERTQFHEIELNVAFVDLVYSGPVNGQPQLTNALLRGDAA